MKNKDIQAELTPRQQEVLEYFLDRNNWRPPSHAQAARHFSIGRQAILEHLTAICKKGYLDRVNPPIRIQKKKGEMILDTSGTTL